MCRATPVFHKLGQNLDVLYNYCILLPLMFFFTMGKLHALNLPFLLPAVAVFVDYRCVSFVA